MASNQIWKAEVKADKGSDKPTKAKVSKGKAATDVASTGPPPGLYWTLLCHGEPGPAVQFKYCKIGKQYEDANGAIQRATYYITSDYFAKYKHTTMKGTGQSTRLPELMNSRLSTLSVVKGSGKDKVPVQIEMTNKELCECIKASIQNNEDNEITGDVEFHGKELPLDGLYVRLRPDHVKDLNIGGYEDPERGDEIYVPQNMIAMWSGKLKADVNKSTRRRPRGDSVTTWHTVSTGPKETPEPPISFIWARNEYGRAVMWLTRQPPTVDYKKWETYYTEAIRDREGLGLRWIDPMIELLLVPVGDNEIELESAIKRTEERLNMTGSTTGANPRCRQTVRFMRQLDDINKCKKAC